MTMQPQIILLILIAGSVLLMIGVVTVFSNQKALDGIKSKTVGDGQHGTARWATPKEIQKIYTHVPFRPAEWREGKNLPKAQGLVLGSQGAKNKVTALVDGDDIHCLMIGASGVGKTAFFLYPNLEYACASGMSYLALDTKGDLARNYGTIAKNCYGYQVSVIDLRNPTRSDGNNFLALVNRYMDITRKEPANVAARAKAEKYAKILSKTIINPSGDDANYGQNAFFYDAAEGLLTSVILLLAEFLPPKEVDGQMQESWRPPSSSSTSLTRRIQHHIRSPVCAVTLLSGVMIHRALTSVKQPSSLNSEVVLWVILIQFMTLI